MGQHLVVVTDHDFDDLSAERDVLRGIADVRTLSRDVGDVDADPDLLERADGVLNLRAEIDRPMVDRLDSARIIARYGIGVDNVDVEAASERDVYVTNVPDYCIEEVSTHALALVLSLSRSLKRYDSSIATGGWDRESGAPIRRFSTLTVGILGFGEIGRKLGERVRALGADVIASDPYVDDAGIVDYRASLRSFDALLEESDIVSVHAPLTDTTRGLFDSGAFRQMRDDAYLINVSRGPIVDGAALLDALDTGELAGAGLDVFPAEPPAVDEPLRNHEAVITTPHVGWYSEEANSERRRSAAQAVRQALTGERPENLVNGDAVGNS